MKRRYLAVLLAASTAVSQIFGTASIALAAELIAEPEAVYTDAEEFGEIMPEELIFDAETPDEGQANQSFADLNEEAPENQPLEDLVEEGQANTTPEEPTEYGQADAYDTAELSLDPTFSILSIEPETTPEGLADEAEAVPQNEDNEETKTGPKLELAWKTGTNCMTPGSSQMLHVEAWVDAENEYGDIYRTQCDGIGFGLEGLDENSGITVEVQEDIYTFDGYTAYGMYEVTVVDTAAQNEALAEDDEAGDENADTVSFTVKAYAADQDGNSLAEDKENAWTTSKTATIEVTDSYTNLEPSSIEPMLVGEKQTIPAEYKKYTYQEESRTSEESIENIRYRWEWDPEQMELSYVPADISQESSTEEERIVLSNDNPENTYVIADEGVEFQLRRLTNDDITIKLYAEEWKKNESNTEEQQAAESGSGEWIKADSREYYFGRIDYITNRLILADNAEENADFQDRLFNCETVTLTVEATDEVKDDPNWTVNWVVGIFDENEDCYTTELLEKDEAYFVSEDTKQITLDGKKIQAQLNLQDEEWFNINAEVVVNIDTDDEDNPIQSYVDGVGRGICLYEASQELRDLPWENQDVIKGREAWLPKEGRAWIRNPQFPDGQNCSVQIKNVTVCNAAEEGNESSVSCKAMTTDDGYEGYQFEAVNYGQAKVTVSYLIETGTTDRGEPVYSDEYMYDYRVNVCEDYFNLNLTSNRDNNGYTNLRPGESVTLYASMDEDYESNDTLRPVRTEVVWRAEPAEKVSLKPSEDGLSCEVTAAAGADTQVKVTAALMVISADESSAERAQASWDINICDEYFVIELEAGEQGSNYSYGLEHGESITVAPKLYQVNQTQADKTEVTDVEWRWEEWDEEKLTIKDKNAKQLSTEEEDGNTGTAPFTLTKQGSEWTNLCLRAYADGYEGALADLWLTFEEQNYDIWYENLKEDGWTWFYTDDQNPTIELNVTYLLDKDQYRLEWTLGTFDEDGNLVSEMDNVGDITYYTLLPVTLSDGTVIKDAAVQLDLSAVQGWLEGWEDESEAEKLDYFSVQVSVYTKTEEENEEEALYLGGTHCADVWLNETVDKYDFGLELEEDRVLRVNAGSEQWISSVFSRYIENAEYPDGEEVYLPISDVQLKVAEAYPQKSILLNYDKENEGWNLEFLNPCEAKLAITYTGMDGKDTTETIPIEVLRDCYYLNLSSESLLLYAGENQKVSANVIYWQQNQEDIENPKGVTIKWEITEEWPANEDADSVLTISPDSDSSAGENGIVTGKSCLIGAVADGEAKIVLRAYDQNDEVLATADLWVYVNAYKLVDENKAAAQQYTDIGQAVELALKLQESDSETGAGKDYEGQVRYVWEYSAENLQLECLDKQVALSSEDDMIYMITEQKASGELEDAESNAVQISLKRIASEGGYAEVKAEILDAENKEWQEVASQEWQFEEYGKELWPEDTRGDYYTWIYTDETNYTLSMNTSDGLLENGRYLKWTIGIAKDGRTIAVYPEKSETANGANENSNYTTDGRSLTIKSGGDLNTWITGQKAEWQAENQGQDPDETLEVFIEAAVMRDIPAEEESQTASEQSNAGTPAEICSCRIGFDTREPYEEWEDSYYSTFLLGGTSLYYEYDTEKNCYWISKYVENQEHPWGTTETCQLISIAAQNLDENFETDESSSSDPVIQVDTTAGRQIDVVPLRAGNARLTYTYNDGTSENKTFSFDVTVVGSTYAAYVSLPGDADHMQLGETKQIRLVVKQLESVWNDQNQIWEIRRSDLTEDQYTVSYHDWTDGRLAVREDGKVTVLDNREDRASIGITVTIPQGDAEPYKLQTSFGFSVADAWYTFDTAQSYAGAPGETITISPRLCYYENGTLAGYAEVDQLNLTPEWYDDTVSARLADGTITVNSSKEGSGSFCLTANYTDQYGYHREISTSIWFGFCDHTHNEADGWQTAYWSTCSETGRKEKWCSKCGWVMETAKIPMLAHSWDNGVVSSAPTCQKEGVRTFTCTACAATTIEPISKTTHQAGSWQTEKAATCTTGGTEVQRCTACGTVVNSRTTAAKGHQAGGWTLQNGATCTTGGKEVQKCTTCGTVVDSRTTAAKAHTAGSWQTENAATCTADGTETQKCTVCGTTLNRRTTGKTGHLWSSYTTTKQPTGVEEGWEVRNCQKCHHSEGRAIAKLPATIKLTEKKLTLQLKKSAVIKSIVTGLSEGDAIASWTSSNSQIVTVNQNGKLTGKKLGNAEITVTLKSGISARIPVTVQKKEVATQKLTVASKSIKLTKGSKLTLQPIRTPVTTLDKVTYTTSNKKVAVVNSKGQITAKAAGKATITIKSGKKSVKVKVTVAAVQPTKITGIPKAKTLKVGKSLTLKPKFSPKGSEATVKYSTSNKKVAAVSTKGKITAKKKGTAVITIKAGKAKATCKITVK